MIIIIDDDDDENKCGGLEYFHHSFVGVENRDRASMPASKTIRSTVKGIDEWFFLGIVK